MKQLFGKPPLKPTEKSIRMAYQTAVIATAALRSWALHWLIVLRMNPRADNRELTQQADQIMTLISGAHQMIDTGIDVEFNSFDLEITPQFGKSRAKAVELILDCLTHFGTLADAARNDTLTDADIQCAISDYVDPASNGMTQVLAELDQLVAQSEKTAIDTQLSLIREAIGEMGKNNMTIGMIAINASVEAAHVGDAGRGFSVIAHEIQNLSKKAKTAFDDLTSRIN